MIVREEKALDTENGEIEEGQSVQESNIKSIKDIYIKGFRKILIFTASHILFYLFLILFSILNTPRYDHVVIGLHSEENELNLILEKMGPDILTLDKATQSIDQAFEKLALRKQKITEAQNAIKAQQPIKTQKINKAQLAHQQALEAQATQEEQDAFEAEQRIVFSKIFEQYHAGQKKLLFDQLKVLDQKPILLLDKISEAYQAYLEYRKNIDALLNQYIAFSQSISKKAILNTADIMIAVEVIPSINQGIFIAFMKRLIDRPFVLIEIILPFFSFLSLLIYWKKLKLWFLQKRYQWKMKEKYRLIYFNISNMEILNLSLFTYLIVFFRGESLLDDFARKPILGVPLVILLCVYGIFLLIELILSVKYFLFNPGLWFPGDIAIVKEEKVKKISIILSLLLSLLLYTELINRFQRKIYTRVSSIRLYGSNCHSSFFQSFHTSKNQSTNACIVLEKTRMGFLNKPSIDRLSYPIDLSKEVNGVDGFLYQFRLKLMLSPVPEYLRD